jgi:hypothetical protein
VWLAADPSTDGLIHEGGQNTTIHNSGKGVVNPGEASQPARPGTVPQIASLSTNPDALLKQIYSATRGEAPGKDAAAFNWIGETVSESIVPGDVASSIWRAAAKIPGVVLVKDATDAAGRHGEAIAHVSNGERTEYIFDRNTHLFLGERSYLIKDTPMGKAGMLTGTSAVLSLSGRADPSPHQPGTHTAWPERRQHRLTGRQGLFRRQMLDLTFSRINMPCTRGGSPSWSSHEERWVSRARRSCPKLAV